MMTEHLIIAGLFAFLIAKEILYRRHVADLEEKLFARDPESYKAMKSQEQPANQIVNTGTEEDPNEIPISDDNPFPLPKEFNLQIEGEDKPRHIKLEGES